MKSIIIALLITSSTIFSSERETSLWHQALVKVGLIDSPDKVSAQFNHFVLDVLVSGAGASTDVKNAMIGSPNVTLMLFSKEGREKFHGFLENKWSIPDALDETLRDTHVFEEPLGMAWKYFKEKAYKGDILLTESKGIVYISETNGNHFVDALATVGEENKDLEKRFNELGLIPRQTNHVLEGYELLDTKEQEIFRGFVYSTENPSLIQHLSARIQAFGPKGLRPALLTEAMDNPQDFPHVKAIVFQKVMSAPETLIGNQN